MYRIYFEILNKIRENVIETDKDNRSIVNTLYLGNVDVSLTKLMFYLLLIMYFYYFTLVALNIYG